jgi:chromosome segregation ATPase
MNNASQKCEQLERDLLKVNELRQLSDEKLRQNLENSDFKISLMEAKIESAQDMFNKANTEKMQLLQDLRNANIKLSELESENARLKLANEGDPERDFEQASDLVKSNAELARRLRELQAYSNAYAEEKQSLIEQIEKYEVDLTKVEALLKSKSVELDNAMFSLKKERESWQNEKSNLLKETNGAGQSSLAVGYKKDIGSLIKVNEGLCNKMTNESKNATQKLQYAHENRVKVHELTQENKKLAAENLRLVNDSNKCMLRIGELSDHLVSARQQLKKMSDLSCELMSTQQQLQDSMNGAKSAYGKWVRSESEKSELCDRLNDANAKIKELNGRISVTSTELKIQEKAKAQLQSSFSRVQQLVDALSSENSDMKKQNESLEKSLEYLEKRSHEIQQLLSATSIDRDSLLESNKNLSSMFDMLSHERDEAVHEKERFKANLDRVAADFEAGKLLLQSTHGRSLFYFSSRICFYMFLLSYVSRLSNCSLED